MSGIDVKQLKYEIVKPALEAVFLYSDAALNLVTGTALAESVVGDTVYVRQVGGPALGLWQMEPATHDDCWKNFLDYRTGLKKRVLGVMVPGSELRSQLVYNLRYGAVMCRVKYLRSTAPLPDANDAAALSAYHKRIYNSALGAADPNRNIQKFAQAIGA